MGRFIAAVRHLKDDMNSFIVGQGKSLCRDAYRAGSGGSRAKA
jgi:hypothetical protein